MFNELVEEAAAILPGFGEHLALDGKAISSFAVKPGSIEGDLRGYHDASWGIHVDLSYFITIIVKYKKASYPFGYEAFHS